MLRPCFQAPLQERLVVNGKVDAEASGRGGKYRKKEPALPIIERPGWPKNERDEEDNAEYALDSGFSIKRIHFPNSTPDRSASGTCPYRKSKTADGNPESESLFRR
jgi:hypothetical protein